MKEEPSSKNKRHQVSPKFLNPLKPSRLFPNTQNPNSIIQGLENLISDHHLISYPFRVAAFFLILIWLIFFLGQIPLPVIEGFFRMGITPRSSIGLLGIFTAPWIHADFNHLISNQSLFLHLVFLSILRPGREGITIFLLIASTGFGVWLFGMDGNHIGASGLIFALQGFNLITAFYYRRWLLLGSMTLFLLIENTFFHGIFGWVSFDGTPISYSSHISGLVCGILWARILRKKPPASPVSSPS